jgi:RNA polymerase sigma factor (sigma-70 family)
LDTADAADVSQAVWLRLVENLRRIRDPDALPSWLATTTRREAVALLRRRYEVPLSEIDGYDVVDEHPPPWQPVLVEERDTALWKAFGQLSPRCQQVLRLLVAEPAGYTAASAVLGTPVGSLGPMRARCLGEMRQKLRAYLAEGGVGDAR